MHTGYRYDDFHCINVLLFESLNEIILVAKYQENIDRNFWFIYFHISFHQI